MSNDFLSSISNGTPPKESTPTLPKWAETIAYTDDESKQLARVLVYGRQGVGKTHFLGTFPDPFFINTDKGLMTLKDKHIMAYNVPFRSKVYNNILDILMRARDKKPPFDERPIQSIVFDSLTELANIMMWEIMAYPDRGEPRYMENTKPVWDDYSKLQGRLYNILKICEDVGLHIGASAGVKVTQKADETVYEGLPSLIGSLRETIGHRFTEVYYMEPEKNRGEFTYYAHTQKFGIYDCKSQWGLRGKIPNPRFNDIYTKDIDRK